MRLWYNFNRNVALVHMVSLFGLRTYGRERVPYDRPVLLVSNHQSYLDPMIVGCGLPCELDFTPRASLFDNRVFGAFIRSLNAFPLERGQADIAAIKRIITRLRQGRSVVLFPEGTRTRDGRITPFKEGLDLIARRAEVATVPVVVDGAFEAWPRHQAVPSLSPISVMYGQAITAEQTGRMRRQEFVGLVNERLREMQGQLRRMAGKEAYAYSQ